MTRFRCLSLVCIILCVLPTTPAAAQSPAQVLSAVVGLRTHIPPDARTAQSLGTERTGSGVVIDDNGLILTIGYLILEADSVRVRTGNGKEAGARIVAYDHATGFGLVRAHGDLGVSKLELGDSGDLKVSDPVLVISSGGPEGVRPATVVDRREFSGYWEYLLLDAIFVSPPHPFFSGSALIGPDNRLVGIGSLIVSNAIQGEQPEPGNMFIPIDGLKPILDSLVRTGRDPAPRRPWVGIYTEEYRGHVFVTRVAEDSPASRAGVNTDDIILKVGRTPVSTMAGFFRAIWGLGKAGVVVPLTVLRDAESISISLASTDRYQWLKLNPGRLTAHLTDAQTYPVITALH